MKRMLKHFATISLFAVVFSCASTGSKNNSEIALEDFFKNSVASQFRISPDGKKIAALRPYKERMNIFVRDFNSTKEESWERLTDITDRDVAGIFWKGNEHILFSRDFGGDENFHIFSVDIKSKSAQDLTPFKDTKVSILDDLDGISKTDILIQSNQRNKEIFDVYRLNVKTGSLKIVGENPGNFSGWITDHTGYIRMAVATDGVNNTLFYRNSGAKKFKKVKTLNFKEELSPLFFDFKNKYIYALSNLNRNTASIVLLDPSTGKEIKQIYSNENYDIGGLNYSKKRKELTTVFYTDWKLRRHFYSNYYKNIFADLETKIPNKEIMLTSSNDDENSFIVFAASDKSRGEYHTYDAVKKELKFLLNPSPWLDENKMASMKPIQYTSRDGLKIEGYLTLPKGKESSKNLPLVVNPHGGPWARDTWGYNPEIQFLANRGFAVLQMNFRGSVGYGKSFWMSSFKQWGRKMQNDITDGVNWAIKEGIADKNRICIYGGSYGGYATLAGLTYTPDLYKCGVDYVGVSNLLSFMNTIPPYWKPYLAMLHEMVGDPEKDKAELMAASPFFNAEKIKAPLFVAQGAKDPRVNKNESDQIVEALKKRGIEVPYMVKDNEGHGFHNQENRFEFYREMEKFLKKHLK